MKILRFRKYDLKMCVFLFDIKNSTLTSGFGSGSFSVISPYLKNIGFSFFTSYDFKVRFFELERLKIGIRYP